jgi:hypothetical protein
MIETRNFGMNNARFGFPKKFYSPLIAIACTFSVVSFADQPVQAPSARQAIIFGGACLTPKNNDNLPGNKFLPVVGYNSNVLRKNGWDVTLLFGDAVERCKFSASNPRCQGAQPSADCCLAGVQPDSLWSINAVAQEAGFPDGASIPEASKSALFASLDKAIQTLPPGSELLLTFDADGGFAPRMGAPLN